MVSNPNQQSAMMKTDAGTCASLSVSLLTTSIPEAEWNSLPEACVNADTITAFQTHAAPLRALSGVHTPPPIVVIRESGLTLIVLELELELEYQQSNQTSHSHQPKIYPTVFKRYFLIGLNDNEKFFLFLLFLLLLLPCKGE